MHAPAPEVHRNAHETLAEASAAPQLDETWLASHNEGDAGGPLPALAAGAKSVGGTTMKTASRRRMGRGGTFDSLGLSKHILSGLKRLNYKLPTPIQRQTLPITLAGKDIMAMARTGE